MEILERKITITECDVCGHKEKRLYSHLKHYGWTKYKMSKEWTSGVHEGEHDTEIVVCDNCDNRKGIRYFFFKILKPFINRIKIER
jgi:hypothetical protein